MCAKRERTGMLYARYFATTPLHCDISCAVNILMDVSLPGGVDESTFVTGALPIKTAP